MIIAAYLSAKPVGRLEPLALLYGRKLNLGQIETFVIAVKYIQFDRPLFIGNPIPVLADAYTVTFFLEMLKGFFGQRQFCFFCHIQRFSCGDMAFIGKDVVLVPFPNTDGGTGAQITLLDRPPLIR